MGTILDFLALVASYGVIYWLGRHAGFKAGAREAARYTNAMMRRAGITPAHIAALNRVEEGLRLAALRPATAATEAGQPVDPC